MTIEERYRAEQCTNCHLNNYCNQLDKEKRCDRFLSLIKGATEQKEIDDKRIAELEELIKAGDIAISDCIAIWERDLETILDKCVVFDKMGKPIRTKEDLIKVIEE